MAPAGILVHRRFDRVSYDPALLWAGAASLAALAPLAGWWLILAVPALVLHRQTRHQLAALAGLAQARLPLRSLRPPVPFEP